MFLLHQEGDIVGGVVIEESGEAIFSNGKPSVFVSALPKTYAGLSREKMRKKAFIHGKLNYQNVEVVKQQSSSKNRANIGSVSRVIISLFKNKEREQMTRNNIKEDKVKYESPAVSFDNSSYIEILKAARKVLEKKQNNKNNPEDIQEKIRNWEEIRIKKWNSSNLNRK